MGGTSRFQDVGVLRLESSHLPVFLYTLGGTVIDAGFTKARKHALAWLREVKPARVVVTHHHEDHSGNVAGVAAMGIPLLAHPCTVELVRDGFHVPPYRRRIWGEPERAACQSLPARLAEGGFTLDAHHVPGHAEDMIALHEPDRGWLFSADLYIATRPTYLRADEDPNLIIDSLKRVLRLEFSTVFCAHRGVLPDGRAKIQQKLAYLEDLRGQIRELAGRGVPERQIARRLLGREGLIYYWSRGEFARLHFVRRFAAETASLAHA